MITRSKQNWSTGQAVKVGFMTLIVVQAVVIPDDFKPDAYLLTNQASTKLYKFVPHNGLTSIDVDEANELIAANSAHAVQLAARVIAKAQAAGRLATQLLGGAAA